MTAYTCYVATDNIPASLTLGIAPGSYQIRLASIVMAASWTLNGGAVVTSVATVSRYSGGLSAGSAVPIAALRQGSPAATASATNGSGSGTQNVIGYAAATNYTFQPPFDVIVSPGSSLVANFSFSYYNASTYYGGGIAIIAYFEELRLSWHT